MKKYIFQISEFHVTMILNFPQYNKCLDDYNILLVIIGFPDNLIAW